jgi:hypothetical protein
LRLRPGGEDNDGASDDQRAAHTPMRADRVSPYKACESRGASTPERVPSTQMRCMITASRRGSAVVK